MYYDDEVRKPESLDGDLSFREAEVRKAEMEMARALVENLGSEFEPSKYTDTYRSELMELIRQKAEGLPLPEPHEEEAEGVDLMQALRESVERTKRARQPRGRGRSRARRAS
jgi:DNA end-binding protein Ku